ncbi:MAG: hypothetical protein ABSF95_21080 [Verrucomicrobiota bacterium]|jgi:hypothetical protein
MKTWFVFLVGCGLVSEGLVGGAEPVLRVVKASQSGAMLLRNGDFEQAAAGKLRDWAPAPQGYSAASGEGRNRSQALRCENPNGSGWVGASQTLALNRTQVAPLVVRGWSKAQDVTGGSDNDYSLYVDIVYADGTPLWGQTANFHTGTHDWEQRERIILPEKPVKTLTLHCLLRGHAGTAWFDDVAVDEIKAGEGAVLFQGVAVKPVQEPGRPAGEAAAFRTRDGLELQLRDGTVASLQVDGRELAGAAPSGFLARDVAANSDIYGLAGGECSELGLKLRSACRGEADHIVVEGRLADLRGADRAITLIFALPVDAAGWHWGDDIRRSRLIVGQGEFANTVGVHCGATGTLSLYPLAAMHSDRAGLALALDMAHPAQFRLGYHAGTRQFYIAFDFGLAPETEGFPGAADFRFVLFRFEPRWGFRAAFQKLMEIFADYFRVRAREQGLWMPFTDVSTVQDWQDFGFKFHEGNNNVPWDDAHGILSFRYTEPMTWWMRLAKDAPRTLAEARRVRDQLAQSGQGAERQMALASRVAGVWDDAGQPCLLFRNEPWCNGAVWSLNPNPALPAAGQTRPAGQSAGEEVSWNAATVHWNESIKQRLYGPGAKGQLDGEYLDSLEGYVTADLNFRREHFRYTSVPLTFASDSKKPALYKGLAVFEFTRWICEEVHRLGKLTFANGVPYRFTFLCPWLDVLGTETDWLYQGQYRPASDAQMSLWRAMSGRKPYLLLMNTDYDAFTPELVERYFQRSLFYGFWPGMFSHNAAENPYWQNPKWYNRDRPLFKKYLPLVRRVAEAGWQPVTHATCDNERIWVERFGPDPAGAVYFTLFNDTATGQTGALRADTAALRMTGAATAQELVSGNALPAAAAWELSLPPQETKVIELKPAR